MRAARLLDMLLVLQRRGQMTARELAALLEVSQRTILRDVDALSEAGVPIRTRRGPEGGIELLNGFQTRLTGLTEEEARSLYLVGQPVVADLLGLDLPTRSVRHKLDTAIPLALAGQADSLATWFVHDPVSGGPQPVLARELPRIARCVRRRHRVELHLRADPAVLVEPLGLVLTAGSWRLVAGDGHQGREPTVIGLDLLRATRLTTQLFEAPPDFVLADFWAAYAATAPRPSRGSP